MLLDTALCSYNFEIGAHLDFVESGYKVIYKSESKTLRMSISARHSFTQKWGLFVIEITSHFKTIKVSIRYTNAAEEVMQCHKGSSREKN